LSALIKSGAVSTSVPSRSNTTVRTEFIENRYLSSCNHASARSFSGKNRQLRQDRCTALFLAVKRR